MDDILDVLGSTDAIGKPVGHDLLQGVLTLPTIRLIERYPDDNPINALFQEGNDSGHLESALDMIRNSGIVEECYAVVRDYCTKASHDLKTLDDGPVRRPLMDLAFYVMERTR